MAPVPPDVCHRKCRKAPRIDGGAGNAEGHVDRTPDHADYSRRPREPGHDDLADTGVNHDFLVVGSDVPPRPAHSRDRHRATG